MLEGSDAVLDGVESREEEPVLDKLSDPALQICYNPLDIIEEAAIKGRGLSRDVERAEGLVELILSRHAKHTGRGA